MIMRGITITMGLLLLWQIMVTVFHLPIYILPSPVAVFKAWFHYRNLLMQESIPTIIETLIGLFLGSIFGILCALMMTYFSPIRRWFLPILLISQALPTFAIAPLLVVWFGYGIASKIITTMIMIFFPITSNFYDGLKQTKQIWLDLAKTMNGSRLQILRRIKIPAALPSLASGLRIAATIAPIGAVIGEWVGASQGLGYLMLNSNARMQIDLMFAALITIIALTISLYFAIDLGLRKTITWQKS